MSSARSMKLRFSIGDLVAEHAIPTIECPPFVPVPLLVVDIDEVGDSKNWDGDTIYLVVEPGGRISQHFEYEIIRYEDTMS